MCAAVLAQSGFTQRSVQRAFFSRKPVNARVIRMAAKASVQLSQDELKKQASTNCAHTPRHAVSRGAAVDRTAGPIAHCGSLQRSPSPMFQSPSPYVQAAWKAVEYVKSGMVVGLGTGSTAAFAVDRIGQLLKDGELKDIVGVPTSIRTFEQAQGEISNESHFFTSPPSLIPSLISLIQAAQPCFLLTQQPTIFHLCMCLPGGR